MSVDELIRRYFHGVNHEDWDDFRGIWHDDAVIEVVGGGRVQGWDEILPYYRQALSGFPVHHDDPYAVHVAGDVVTVEIAFTGETVEGVPAAFEAVDVFAIEDGLIRKLTTWYDLDRVVRFLRTPGTPERRLRALVGHAAAASPYYRARLAALGLDPDALAADLSLVPPTRLDGVDRAELVAVPERAVVALAGTVPLTRDDLAERGRLWAQALALAGIGRGDAVALEPSPGFAEGVAAARARLAFGAAGAARRVAGVLELPEAGVVAAPCREGALHALTGAHVVEVVDGELLVTPLGARGLPLLRLATGIGAAWLGASCSCGSELPVLRRTEPR